METPKRKNFFKLILNYIRKKNKPMKKISLLFSIFYLLFCSFSIAQSYSGPESVEWIPGTHDYLVSNTNSGEIQHRHGDGTLTLFVGGFTSGPHGMEIVGDTVYCCSGGHLKGYLLSTAAPVFDVNFSASFLNGITHDNNGNIFATDFSAKKVYRYKIATGAWNVFVTGLVKTPNGIIFDQPNNRLVMVSWGANAPIMGIALTDSSVSQLKATTMGSCDGIARDTAGNFYVSAWSQNALFKFDNTFTAAQQQVMSGLSSPADLGYNMADSIGIPNSNNNTVVFYHIPAPNQIVAPQKKTIDVFPSPVLRGENLTIRSSGNGSTISIFDLNGRAIFSSPFNQEIKINTVLFSSGIFFYDVEEDNSHARGKFIVQ